MWFRVGEVRLIVPVVVFLGIIQSFLPQVTAGHQLRAVQETDVPTALVTGTLGGVVVAWSAVEPQEVVWRLAIPRFRWRGAVRVVLLLGTLFAVVAAGAPESLPAMVNVGLVSTAEALLVASLVDRRLLWALAGTHAAMSALLGAVNFGQLQWWAWTANPLPSLTSLTVGSTLLGVALVVLRCRGTADRL